MARRRSRSSPDQSGFSVFLIIVACTSFSLGILNPAVRPATGIPLARAMKTEMRALADGNDLGRTAWVGLNDPSVEQTVLQSNRLAMSVAETPAKRREVAAGARRKAGLLRVARNGVAGY